MHAAGGERHPSTELSARKSVSRPRNPAHGRIDGVSPRGRASFRGGHLSAADRPAPRPAPRARRPDGPSTPRGPSAPARYPTGTARRAATSEVGEGPMDGSTWPPGFDASEVVNGFSPVFPCDAGRMSTRGSPCGAIAPSTPGLRPQASGEHDGPECRSRGGPHCAVPVPWLGWVLSAYPSGVCASASNAGAVPRIAGGRRESQDG